MAKINESVIIVKVSELIADTQEAHPLLDSEVLAQLEAVISELVGGKALVEIENPDV